MTHSTTPGWYRVPGADNGPGYERWWDGNAWTSEVRPLQDAAQAPRYGYPAAGQTGHPAADYGRPGPAYPPPASNRRIRTGVISAAVSGTLALCTIVAALTIGHSDDPQAGPGLNPTGSPYQSATPTPAPTTAKPAPDVTGIASDPQHAITIPILDGWATEPTTDRQYASTFVGTGRYTCNGGHHCLRGLFAVANDTIPGATAKDAADTAMPGWADALYPGSQHTDYGSGSMSVDGVPGYAERWHVRTSTGTQGYVLLACFQAKGGGYVMFEGAVDDDVFSPDKGALEQILNGIRQADSSRST
ncbi:DUF2510 domain-containing protein [Kitasatospora aureofaciens]|uniref:DUF2510 domain-containing protein n=1 Tax=Kitasatospora aureofaciens TaxID=1894 RepID=UPI0006893D5A|nr:DUF2510 domain-containing protein [Kitasatospora aureofaciens]